MNVDAKFVVSAENQPQQAAIDHWEFVATYTVQYTGARPGHFNGNIYSI